MDEQQRKQSEKRNRFSKLDIAIILVIILILIAVAVPTAIHFLYAGQAREVLGRAKTVCLATQVAAYDYYAEGTSIMESSRDSGLVVGAEERILKDADAQKGKLFRVKLQTSTCKVRKLVYVENGYAAIYVKKGDEPTWNVYRVDRLISE